MTGEETPTSEKNILIGFSVDGTLLKLTFSCKLVALFGAYTWGSRLSSYLYALCNTSGSWMTIYQN